jgi:hypothetical protein
VFRFREREIITNILDRFKMANNILKQNFQKVLKV